MHPAYMYIQIEHPVTGLCLIYLFGPDYIVDRCTAFATENDHMTEIINLQ